jgi:O-antigen/teichoic acid export membrane protein
MLSQLDVLIMGAILSAPAVAAFQAPARLLSLATYPGMALANAFGPRVADRADMARTSAALASAVRRLVLVQGFAAALVAAYADVIVHLALGHRYVGTSAESVLRVMSPFVLLSGLAPLFSTTIDYLGGARRRIPIAAATLFVNVTINLVLLRRIGPVAAAIAVDAGYVVFVFGHAFVATRLLGLDLRSIGRTLAAITLAATLMTAAVGLIRTLSGGVPVTVVAGIAGSCLFAAAVVVSRQHRGLLNGGG